MTEELPTFLIGIKPINLIRQEKTLSISCFSAWKATTRATHTAMKEKQKSCPTHIPFCFHCLETDALLRATCSTWA